MFIVISSRYLDILWLPKEINFSTNIFCFLYWSSNLQLQKEFHGYALFLIGVCFLFPGVLRNINLRKNLENEPRYSCITVISRPWQKSLLPHCCQQIKLSTDDNVLNKSCFFKLQRLQHKRKDGFHMDF